MAIHFISGKPGSGKTLYGVHLLIKEITQGSRNVVTNLPLHAGRLNEYLQQMYPGKDFRLLQRLTILTEEQAREFWKYRGEQEQPVGVMFQLDELHLFFNARDWMNTGKACLHYLSQHRKLGDVVIAITQSVPNVDKQFRSVAEDFTVLRNEYTARFGPFRGRGRFVRKTYNTEPTGSDKHTPFETATFTLDAQGIASCYDTAQGIGIHGNAADKGRRAPGWSIWWTIPLGLGLAAACGFVPFLLGRGAQKIIAPAAPIEASKEPNGLNKPAPSMSAIAKSPSEENAGNHQANGQSVAIKPTVTGISRYGEKFNIQLSNGSQLTEMDHAVLLVLRDRIVLRTGQQLFLAKPQPPTDRGAGASPDRPQVVERKETPLPETVQSPSTQPKPASTEPDQQPSDSPGEGSGSWVTDKDGVQRLRKPETLSALVDGTTPTQNVVRSRSRASAH